MFNINLILIEKQVHAAGNVYRAMYLEFSVMNFKLAMIVVR